MTILLFPQELQREILGPRDRIVIPTGAKRSGGTCGSFGLHSYTVAPEAFYV
jgi:hypothetical protein